MAFALSGRVNYATVRREATRFQEVLTNRYDVGRVFPGLSHGLQWGDISMGRVILFDKYLPFDEPTEIRR